MKIYRTEAALLDEPLSEWGLDSYEVSAFVRVILEDLLWDFLEGDLPAVDFTRACEGLSLVEQGYALGALEFLLKLDVVKETAPFLVELCAPDYAMILAGFYPESHARLATSKEALIALTDKAQALIDSVGVDDTATEIARRAGLFGKIRQ